MQRGGDSNENTRRSRSVSWGMGWALLGLGLVGPCIVAAAVGYANYGYVLGPGLPDARLRNPAAIQCVAVVYTSNGVVTTFQRDIPSLARAQTSIPRLWQTYHSFLQAYGVKLAPSDVSATLPPPPATDGLFETLVQEGVLSAAVFRPEVPSSFEGAVIHFTSTNDEPLVGVILSIYGPDIYRARIVQVVARGDPTKWEVLHARSFTAPIANQSEAPLFENIAPLLYLILGAPLIALGVIVLGVRKLLLIWDHQAWQCPFCRYDVSGLGAATCPECGHALPPGQRPGLAVSDAQAP